MAHWKYNATRCAVPGCERTRVKGWTTCALVAHYGRGVSLYGLAPKAPKLRDDVCNGIGGSHGGHILHPEAEPCPVHPPVAFQPRERDAEPITALVDDRARDEAHLQCDDDHCRAPWAGRCWASAD